MKDRDIQHIRHIQMYCEKIQESVKRFGSDYDSFIKDWDYYQSISMSLMQIGEHSKGLSDTFVNDTAVQVPWKEIRGMRNLFAHEYMKMKEKKVWETVVHDIPGLRSFCDVFLAEYDIEPKPPLAKEGLRERMRKAKPSS